MMDKKTEKYKNLKYDPEICPRCRQAFECSKNCWCMDVELTPDLREWITSRYESCLCENCLKELSGQESPV